MNYLLKAAIVCLVYLALSPNRAQAQFQLNVTGYYLGPMGKGTSFTDGLWGPEVTLRYFTNPHLAVGLNVRYSSKNSSYEATSRALYKDRTTTFTGTGQIEYFFLEGDLRPYVGVEAGLYKSSYKTEYIGPTTTYSNSFTNDFFGVGPKIGLQSAFTPFFGINLEARYLQFIYRSFTENGLLLSAGVFFEFGHK